MPDIKETLELISAIDGSADMIKRVRKAAKGIDKIPAELKDLDILEIKKLVEEGLAAVKKVIAAVSEPV